MFPLIAFTADTVSHLTKLSVRQLHYWDRTGFFTPTFADAQRRRPYSRVYSFQDVVGLRAIAQLRAAGATLQELRKVRSLFRSGANEDWANRRFFVVGKRVFFSHAEAIIAAKPLGQRADPYILDMGPVVADVHEGIQRLPVRSPDQFGKVSRDRWIMGGVPVMDGTRIPTATITWFHCHGYAVDAILEEFPRLTPEDVQAAIQFEEGRVTRAQSPKVAHS